MSSSDDSDGHLSAGFFLDLLDECETSDHETEPESQPRCQNSVGVVLRDVTDALSFAARARDKSPALLQLAAELQHPWQIQEMIDLNGECQVLEVNRGVQQSSCALAWEHLVSQAASPYAMRASGRQELRRSQQLVDMAGLVVTGAMPLPTCTVLVPSVTYSIGQARA